MEVLFAIQTLLYTFPPLEICFHCIKTVTNKPRKLEDRKQKNNNSINNNYANKNKYEFEHIPF
jgi:hypothetical protein